MEGFSSCKGEKFQSSGWVIPAEITGSWNSGSLADSAGLIPVPVRNIPFPPWLSKWQLLVVSHPSVHNRLLLVPTNSYLCLLRWIAVWREMHEFPRPAPQMFPKEQLQEHFQHSSVFRDRIQARFTHTLLYLPEETIQIDVLRCKRDPDAHRKVQIVHWKRHHSSTIPCNPYRTQNSQLQILMSTVTHGHSWVIHMNCLVKTENTGIFMFWKKTCIHWHHSANTKKVKLGMLLRRRHILIIYFLGRMMDLVVGSPGGRGQSEGITVTKLNEIEPEQSTFQIAKQTAENSSSAWENYVMGLFI